MSVDISFDIQPVHHLDFDITPRSGGGTADYNFLMNKPSIEGTALVGNRTLPQIGVRDISEQDIDRIIFG